MPHLSWNEVRDRAIRFSREHAGDRSTRRLALEGFHQRLRAPLLPATKMKRARTRTRQPAP